MTNLPILTPAAVEAYDHLALPVWVFSVENLRILSANSAAQNWLGYDEYGFHNTTIADLRPEADRVKIIEQVRQFDGSTTDAGVWTILAKSGDHYTAAFSWSRVIFEQVEAIVASIRDVTQIVQAEAQAKALLHDNETLRLKASMSAEHLSRLVDGLPGKMLVLTPREYRVVAVTDEYAEAVMKDRDALMGQRLFELFPDDPTVPSADGVHNLRASLQRVETLRVTDVMNLQRYPVRKPDGTYQERFWLPENKPLFDVAGNVIYIVHRVEDVTEALAEDRAESVEAPDIEATDIRRLAEARHALFALRERAARLKTAEMLLDLGSWEYDLDRGALNWSDRVFDIYGVPREREVPDFDSYVAMVHPEDREQMLSTYTEFFESGAPEIEFQHRIIRADRSVSHIRGVGTRHKVGEREIVIGFVQDITSVKVAEDELKSQARRRRLAGHLARLGSWEVDLIKMHVTWCEETAAIHDEPAGTSPTLDNAIGYYAPEHRERVRLQFNACANEGRPFDEILQIKTAKGRLVWVRAIGEPIRNDAGRIVAVEGAFQDITDLMSVREKVDELSARLRRTLEGMSDAFFLLDEEWRFSFVNAQAEILLERGREDLLGKNVWQEFPEASGSKFQEEYERAVAEKQPARFEQHYPPLKKWLEVNADPTPSGLAVYFRDVTQQRARNAQLRLLEEAVSRQNDILVITEAEPIDEPDGPKIVYVNDAFERRTGFTREEVVGRTPRILQGPKTQRDELDRIRNAMEKWEPIRSELINYTKSGEEFWLELDIVPLADETGWFTHWVAIERDITARKQADLTLKSSEERFRLVTKAAGSAIWDWDVKSGQQWWSEGLREIFGHEIDPSRSVPTIWRMHVHPDDVARVEAAFGRIKSGQDNILREQYRFRRADNSWAFVEDKAFSLHDRDGNVLRVLGSMTDISEQKRLEERLHQAQKMETVGQLTGGVAHDFNNLLTVILGNAEILEEELADQPHLKALASMTLEAADRGAELTGRLLAFSRKQALEPKVLDVAKLVRGMDGLLRRALPENIDIEMVRAGGLWKIEADAAQLESALLNLAVNARDAMPHGGCLTFEIANAMLDDDYVAMEADVKPGQYVVIVVTDTGSGILSEHIGRVFEPFFTTKEVGQGSGLGLSMVFGFVKQSGGHIRIYSELGEGTSVKMYFPRSLTEREQVVIDRVGRKFAGGDETILVVEDDDAVRQHVIVLLQGLGYNVLEASAGAEAMDLLRQNVGIDLLFTDVVMPGGMGGRELAEAARKLRPALKVLYTSGYTENSIVHHGRLDRGVKLLNKPYRREQLAAKIREAIDEQGSND